MVVVALCLLVGAPEQLLSQGLASVHSPKVRIPQHSYTCECYHHSRVSRQARTREPQCSLVTMLSQHLLCKPMFVGSCYSKYSHCMKQFSVAFRASQAAQAVQAASVVNIYSAITCMIMKRRLLALSSPNPPFRGSAGI
eukprot:16044-Heterococcus_DN1.PRE.2